MAPWLKVALKIGGSVLFKKIKFLSIFKWIRDFFKKMKFNKKVNKSTKEMEDAETKDEFTDAFNRTP